MDQRAQEIASQFQLIASQFGVTVTVNRTVQSQTPVRSPFGTPLNATTTTFTTNVIVESQKINTMPTLAGGKPKEELKLQTLPGVVQSNDMITYNGHAYKVMFVEPVPFVGTDVVDFIHAERVVD